MTSILLLLYGNQIEWEHKAWVAKTKKNSKEAVLDYEVLKYDKEEDLSLLKIDLHTGRHHQIRVQFSSRGHALYGDQRYGKSDKKQLDLVSVISKLAKVYGCTTCIEGVETKGMESALRTCNVDSFQGYYYSKPLPYSEFLTKYCC